MSEYAKGTGPMFVLGLIGQVNYRNVFRDIETTTIKSSTQKTNKRRRDPTSR